MSRTAVVIPCYNHEKYIAAAVQSVLDQTARPERIIVIDDGSTDGSLKVLEKNFLEEKGFELYAQENLGAHNAINRGITLAAEDCDYVAILNSDDVFEKKRLEKCEKYLEKHREHDVVVTWLKIIDGKGKPLSEDHPRTKWFRAAWSPGSIPDMDIAEWMGTANFPATTSNIFARANYLRANPFLGYRYCHDYAFLSVAAITGRLALLPGELVQYRVHGKNTMDTNPEPLVREVLRMQLQLYRDIGYEALAKAAVRERFEGYSRATWDNISSFHAGMFQSMLARIAASSREDVVQEALVVLKENEFTEVHDYPNKAIVNNYDGENPIGQGLGLAEKYEKLRREYRALKAEHKDLRDLAKVRQKLLHSKRVAMGRLLGKAKGHDTDAGQSAGEKLKNVREAIAKSLWLKGWKF